MGWCLFVAVLLLLACPALAQVEEEDEEDDEEVQVELGERPMLRACPLSADFAFDGRMNDAVWRAAPDSIADLITVEPEEGGLPAGRTVVRVLADQNDIVVGVWCHDDNPQGIVSFSKARDSELEEEDHVVIVFDTFLDARSGYVFAVNPAGARFDGLVAAQGEEVNSDWDTIWEARTSIDDAGWYAEIRIPIKSLSFKKDLSTWGFNVQRRVQRLQETSRWWGASQDYEVYQTSRAGLLEALPDFDLGLGLSIRPALVDRVGKAGSGEDAEYEGDFVLDVTQRLGPNFLAALTLNTDFAETEVDARQVNLTRFPLFFPEKRTFFLEGADIFEFGLGLDEENLLPFFSRRIGLLGLDEDDQAEIPINVGGKINGRVGDTNLGALVVNTRDEEGIELEEDVEVDVPQATMGAVRVTQNVLEESTLGMIGTFGDQHGRSGSWMTGADFTYQTSNFMEEKNFLVGVWGLLNDREDLEGEKSAFGFRVDYPNDLLDVNLTSIRIGDGFDPSLGFVPRNDVHIWDFGGEFNPRPSWPMVRQTFYELSFTLFNDLDNSRWQSYEGTIKPADWLLESGDQFSIEIEPQGDRPPEPFEVADDVDIRQGSYEWIRYGLGVRSAQKRRVSGEIRLEFGDFYNGDLSTIEGALAVKPSDFFALEFSGERNSGDVMALVDDYEELGTLELTDKDFTEQLFGIRLQLNFSPDLQFTSFTQYDTESRELGSNNRLRWTFNRLGDVFVVYNHNVLRTDDDRWEFASNELPVKIQYAWRF